MKVFLSLVVGIVVGFMGSIILISGRIEDRVEHELVEIGRVEVAPKIVDQFRAEITESGDLIPMINSQISQLEEKIEILLLPESERSCALLLSAEKEVRLIRHLKDTIQTHDLLKEFKFPDSPLELFQSSFTLEQIAACQV